MSKQLFALQEKHPDIVQSISLEGEDGYWLYLEPGWYCLRTDCGTIHEYTVKACLQRFRDKTWNPQRWNSEYPTAEQLK